MLLVERGMTWIWPVPVRPAIRALRDPDEGRFLLGRVWQAKSRMQQAASGAWLIAKQQQERQLLAVQNMCSRGWNACQDLLAKSILILIRGGETVCRIASVVKKFFSFAPRPVVVAPEAPQPAVVPESPRPRQPSSNSGPAIQFTPSIEGSRTRTPLHNPLSVMPPAARAVDEKEKPAAAASAKASSDTQCVRSTHEQTLSPQKTQTPNKDESPQVPCKAAPPPPCMVNIQIITSPTFVFM